jgi:DNA-binding transcriptional ArsR family regulator
MSRSALNLVDPRIAKALSHPMRARILVILNERVASPNEIADMIEERLPNVSYHVRALLDLGCIELVDTAQRRGAIEHYYRAVVRPFFTDNDWKRIPRTGRQAISDTLLKVVWDDVSSAVGAGTFDSRSDRALTHQTMTLDDEGWSELRAVLDRTLREIEKIESQSARRLKKADGDGVAASVVMMQFEAASKDASDSDRARHAQQS